MFIARRRTLLALVALCTAALGVPGAVAQDPRASAAQRVARDWLALIDRGDAAASWKSAAQPFQDALISAESWGQALKQQRAPLGELMERTLFSTEFTNSFPGAPEGEYALLVFRSRFTKKMNSRETVTLQRDADGVWRVVGYLIS